MCTYTHIRMCVSVYMFVDIYNALQPLPYWYNVLYYFYNIFQLFYSQLYISQPTMFKATEKRAFSPTCKSQLCLIFHIS